MKTLKDLHLVRAVPVATLQRAAGDDKMPMLEVRFSPFNTWYHIRSFWEGEYMERTSPGAFKKTIDENLANIRCLFNHGQDMSIGDKVLGSIESLSEQSDSPLMEVRMFDTSYNRDLLPGLEAGVYGSSFRFQVIQDQWHDEPERSESNPDGLPERTITEVRLMEAGPVTFPASPTATASVRSMTDAYYEQLRSREPAMVADLEQRSASLRTSSKLPATAGAKEAALHETSEPALPLGGMTPAQRREVLYPTLKGK